MKVVFVTGNEKKWAEVKALLPEWIELQRMNLDLMEIQGSRSEIATFKCKQAASMIDDRNVAIITEDTSLGFTALRNLPGPYIKHFLDAIKHEGLNNLLVAYEDKSATAYCTVAYWNRMETDEPLVFEGSTAGSIVPARGPALFGWDPIFEPVESSVPKKTFAEMTMSEKNAISHRHRAFAQLATHFENSLKQ